MKLVIGLGNPGKKYSHTKHNVGFMAIDHYVTEDKFKKQFNSLIYKTKIETKDVIFQKPLCFMNNSGIEVKKIVDYYKISIEDILVIYDDISFNVGEYKLKPKGSSGGHNGINSIINQLKTEEIKRLKVGINNSYINDLKDYVLSNFNSQELEKLEVVFDTTDLIIDNFIKKDFNYIMNKFNN